MYEVSLSTIGCGGFTDISRDAEMCHGFPPPQATLVIVASGEKGLWVVWCNSCEVRFKEQGMEIRIGMIQICVRIIDVWWRALILSLWSVILTQWARKWMVNFNPNKTEAMLFRYLQDQEYPILLFDNVTVKFVSEHKHLGLT